jgi:hypothetical protein
VNVTALNLMLLPLDADEVSAPAVEIVTQLPLS